MPAVSTKLRIGVIATIVAGGLLLLVPAASSQTVTPQSVDPMQHFIDCAGVLITAPDVHAANCLPSVIGPESNSLASSPDDDGPDCFADSVTLQQEDDTSGDDDCRGEDDGPILDGTLG